MQTIMKKDATNAIILNAVRETKTETKENIKTKKIAMMQELRNSGHSAQEVADLLGCSPNYVYQHTKIDAEMRKRLFVRRVTEWREAALRKRKEYYVPIMLELRKQGYSNVEIGQKTGFAMTTVKKYIGKNPDEIILARVRASQAARRFRERAVRNQAERDAKEMRDAA